MARRKKKEKTKPKQNKKYFAREVKKGGKVLLHSLNYENNYISVTCSAVKIFSAVWTINWIQSFHRRQLYIKQNRYDSYFKKGKKHADKCAVCSMGVHWCHCSCIQPLFPTLFTRLRGWPSYKRCRVSFTWK